MYKSYEIKDINDKIKYANYSIEKLKLIDNDIDCYQLAVEMYRHYWVIVNFRNLWYYIAEI